MIKYIIIKKNIEYYIYLLNGRSFQRETHINFFEFLGSELLYNCRKFSENTLSKATTMTVRFQLRANDCLRIFTGYVTNHSELSRIRPYEIHMLYKHCNNWRSGKIDALNLYFNIKLLNKLINELLIHFNQYNLSLYKKKKKNE